MGRPKTEKPNCTDSSCSNKAVARGLCSKHYQRHRKSEAFEAAQPESLEQRFWKCVDTSGGRETCWPWIGSVHPSGYGTFFVNGGRPRLQKAHRFAYQLTNGTIPAGLEIDHTCHTKECPTPGYGDPHRKCCNPAHLEAVSRTANIRRSQAPEKTIEYYARYREEVTHCPKGHPFSGNTQWRRNKEGYLTRRCAECNRISTREWKKRRAQARRV
ncbi:HNH endonuclease signature motif containing protein [Streptomyces cylindrosporus]|uniref:HNH endonuclease n=1 Tax=Streptomyces cylindrosporus TaxID=2927583 RepID=A0ABS9YK59_9ACTN|nr:HNH endonuclease signature motif containing protein [Streptomyces cylindrosporus]MCI3277648.1 HNH endonuclease [Streptomyces cylindrosporus]